MTAAWLGWGQGATPLGRRGEEAPEAQRWATLQAPIQRLASTGLIRAASGLCQDR